MPSRHQWHCGFWPWRGAAALYCQTWDGCMIHHDFKFQYIIENICQFQKTQQKNAKNIYRPDKIEIFLTWWGTMFAPCSCYFVDMFLTKTDSSRLPSPQVGTFVCDGLGWRSRTSRSTFRATIQLRLRDFSRFQGFFLSKHIRTILGML